MKRTTKVRKNSFHDIAIKVLANSEKPMRVREITEIVLKTKQIPGKTPINTMSSILQRSGFVEKIGPGKYKLKHSTGK